MELYYSRKQLTQELDREELTEVSKLRDVILLT